MRIAVIGAGPAGITAAYELSKNNIKVDVYEASAKIGGMSTTITLWNQKVDIGPHRFFSNDLKVNSLWLEVVGKDYEMVDRLTRIYYKNKFYNYPIKIFNALNNLGLYESVKCLVSYFSERLFPVKQDGSFESWVQNRFGKRLYEIFFKTYTEKLWGINCNELDADFAAQRIKKLSMYEAIKNAIRGGKGNRHKTLVDQFAYPLDGTGMVYERMAEYIKKSGNNIFMNTPVYRILTENGCVKGLELINGQVKAYGQVISSMPFTQMVFRLPEVPETIKELAKSLTYRNTVIVYLLIDSTNVFKDNWLYIHSKDLKMGRITNFRNWSSSLYGKEQKTILAIEYWCNENEEMWKFSDDDFIKQASDEIVKTQLVSKEIIEDGYVYRVNKSYPVYSKGYKQTLAPVQEYVSSVEGLTAIGRYGAFKYNNQDHSILMGIFAAENIQGKAKHKLDEINSDYETYQESCIISETGLTNQS